MWNRKHGSLKVRSKVVKMWPHGVTLSTMNGVSVVNDTRSPVRKAVSWWAIMIILAMLPFMPRMLIDFPPEVYEYRSVPWHIVQNGIGALFTFVVGAMTWLTITAWNQSAKQPSGLLRASAVGITMVTAFFVLLGMVSGTIFWLLDVIVQTGYGWHWT